jgi:hypothetical protein
MLAKLDALRPGDVLRVEADDCAASIRGNDGRLPHSWMHTLAAEWVLIGKSNETSPFAECARRGIFTKWCIARYRFAGRSLTVLLILVAAVRRPVRIEVIS